MLDAQTEDFSSRERFVHAVLGLLSLTERVQALAAPAPSPRPSPRQAGRGSEDVAALLLGLVSVGRTLRATLELAANPPRAPEPVAAAEQPERILR